MKPIINSTTTARIPKELPPMCYKDEPFLETSNLPRHSLHNHLGNVHGNALQRQESRSWDEKTFSKYLWDNKFNSILTRGHLYRASQIVVHLYPLPPRPQVSEFECPFRVPQFLRQFYSYLYSWKHGAWPTRTTSIWPIPVYMPCSRGPDRAKLVSGA